MTSGENTCPLCGRNLEKRLEAKDRWFGLDGSFEVRECASCELGVTLPQLQGDALGRYYPATYESWRPPKGILSAPRAMLARLRSMLPPFGALKARRGGTLLDVGCGRGDLAAHFARAGWQAYGLDNSAAAVAVARQVGVEAHEGTLESAPWQDGSFDLAIMSHSLEHLPDPVGQLRIVRGLLRDDGALIVAVPNWQSWQRRFFGTYWMPLEVPRHLHHFSPRALQLAAGQAGFVSGSFRNYPLGVGLPFSLWFSLTHKDATGRRQQALLMAGALAYPLTWLLGRTLGGDGTFLVARC